MEDVIPEEVPPDQKWIIDILKELHKVLGLIPEPLRKALDYVPQLAEALMRCWNLYKTMERNQALEKLRDIFKRDEPANSEEFILLAKQAKLPIEEYTRAKDYNIYAADCKDIISSIDRLLEEFDLQVKNPILNGDNIRKAVKAMGKELAENTQKLKEKLASDTIKYGVGLSAAIFIVQCFKLKFVWNRIKEAQNLDKSSLPIIQSNVEKLVKGVELLASSMTRFEQIENLNDKKILAKDIELMVSEYGDIYNKTFTMIATLKVNIDGKIQLIYADASIQVLDGVQNLAQTIDAGIKLYQFSDSLTTPLKWVQSTIVAAYVGLTTANAYTYRITKRVLQDLNESMKELENLEKKLEDVGAKIHEARQWLREHIKLLV